MNKDIIELAKQLITIPSETKKQEELKKILNFVKEIVKGYPTQEFETNGFPSLFITNKKQENNEYKIILNAHLDIVPAKNEQYSPIVENDKLIGRGAYDMKAAAAVLILLFKKIANHISYPIALQLVTDEETGGFYGTKHQVDQGIRGKFVIAGENTDLLINNESKGIIWMKLKTEGKTGHGAYPWLGENAIWKMKQNLDILEKEFPIPTQDVWQTTINVATIGTTNTTYNKIPDICDLGLDIRYIDQDKESIVEHITKKLIPGSKHEILTFEPAHYTDPMNIYIKQLQEVIRQVTKKDGKLVSKHGGSDVRFYNKVGVKGVTFGPTGFGHHSDYEWVNIPSLYQYYDILKTFLESIDKATN